MRHTDLKVRGEGTTLMNPFALEFGTALKAATDNISRGYDASQKNFTIICYAVKFIAHPNACAKWVAFGQCWKPDCAKLHDNWPANMNGEVLNSKCRDFAQLAGVPQDWQPAGRRRH